MASITSWVRLEPRIRTADMNVGLQARLYDPLWLLARQWQLGEFEADDSGSPAAARWRGEAGRLSRYHPGPLADPTTPIDGQAIAGQPIPLEALVERERVRPGSQKLDRLRFAAEAGQQFLRMLDAQRTSRSYRTLFRTTYPFAPLTPAERNALDADSLSFVDVIASRVPDGRAMYAALRRTLRPSPPRTASLPAELAIARADVAEVQAAAQAWLDWYDTLITQPTGTSSAWSPERMEYGFSVAARVSAGEKVLTAREYYGGRLDWHDFDLHEGASLRAANDRLAAPLVRTPVPAPVSYRGMPAARFWEFEDAQVDFGAVSAGPEDLARMLLVEFAITYGNDWFVIPVDLPVGTLCRTHSLVVTNTFGERFLIHASSESGELAAAWRMFQLSSVSQPGAAATVGDPSLFLLPPALVTSLESRPIEEVLFLRDEMANMAWGVERAIESATERRLDRLEQRRHPAPPRLQQARDAVRYRLATDVPDYWIPLVPVRSTGSLRLKRAAMFEVEGLPSVVTAKGRILNPEPASPDGLSLFEEEVPREGLHVTRSYQLARWHDGSTHLWIGRRKAVGRGEGSSGLRFDAIQP